MFTLLGPIRDCRDMLSSFHASRSLPGGRLPAIPIDSREEEQPMDHCLPLICVVRGMQLRVCSQGASDLNTPAVVQCRSPV